MIEKAQYSITAKHILNFFLFCLFVSFGYVVVSGKYNGDFLGMPVTLDIRLLILNLILSALPFLLVFKLYKYFKKSPLKRHVTIPIKFFGYFLFILLLWNITMTIFFGVGIMTAPPYEAPPFIKIIIQLANRLNYSYGFFLYVLATSKKNKTQYILLVLILILSFLRAGLGILFYLGMIFYLKYNDEILFYIKRHKIVIAILVINFPILVGLLFQLRSSLRHQEHEEMSFINLITGKLIGRISSFSDSAIILQEAAYFYLGSQSLDNFYFQKQAIGGIFSQNFMPSTVPEKMLVHLYSPEAENVSYMTGTNGNLYISLMKSPFILIVNIGTIIIMILLTFYFCRILRFPYSNEFAFILLCYVLMSGVSNEYAFLFFSIMVYVFIFSVVNLFKRNKKNEKYEDSSYTSITC